MMIRSQDRKTLVPIGEIIIESVLSGEAYVASFLNDEQLKDKFGLMLRNGVTKTLIGGYDSEARCLEILDEIQQMYQCYLSCDGGNPYLQGSSAYPPFAFNQPKVFEMPRK